VLDDQHRAAGALACISLQERAERLGLALGDADGGLVEQQHLGVVGEDAGQVDDAAAAGGQLAGELVAEGAEVHELDELVDLGATSSLGLARRPARPSAAARGPVRCGARGHGDGLGHGERREQPGVLERPAEAAAGPLVGARSVTSWPRSTMRPAVDGQEARDQSMIVVLPAPFGPMRPRISPWRSDEVDVVDGGDAAEALDSPCALEHDGRVLGRRARRTVGGGRWPRGGRSRCRAPVPLEEHRAQDVGALEQLGGGPVEADLALLHEHGPLGQVRPR
jgi:hypothetical protein